MPAEDTSLRASAIRPFPFAPARRGARAEQERQRLRVLTVGLALLGTLVALEWAHRLEFSLGVLYVFPIVVAAPVLTRTQVVLTALGCALIRGALAPDVGLLEFWLRFLMASLAYAGIGLLVVEQSRGRRRMQRAFQRVKQEKTMRVRAEDRLRVLADSSPAGIITLDARARVLAANRAVHDMLGFRPEELAGRSIAEHLPIFAGALRGTGDGRPIRTSASSWAKHANGVLFPITVWFSTYGEGTGRCLAGIIVDNSEEMRDREREAFRHFLDYNRLLAGAVSHEIRNLCSAIRVVAASLERRTGLGDHADFRALSQLTEGLSRMASFELQQSDAPDVGLIDAHLVLDQLRVVIEPDWQDIGGEIHWHLDPEPLPVTADAHALLQVFLNLSQNALRAVQRGGRPTLDIWTHRDGPRLIVSVRDAGPGVADRSVLFQPFGPDAEGTGLGLYVSRALMRNFGGDLRFVPTHDGCRFDVVLQAASASRSSSSPVSSPVPSPVSSAASASASSPSPAPASSSSPASAATSASTSTSASMSMSMPTSDMSSPPTA